MRSLAVRGFEHPDLAVALERQAPWFSTRTVPAPPISNYLDPNVTDTRLRNQHEKSVCCKSHVPFKMDLNKDQEKKISSVEKMFLLPTGKKK